MKEKSKKTEAKLAKMARILGNNPQKSEQKMEELPQELPSELKEQINQMPIDFANLSKQPLFKNVEELDFNISLNWYGIEVQNAQTCRTILQKDNLRLMVSRNFGEGRALAIGNEDIFQELIVRDKNYVIFLRNIMNWLTNNKKNTKEKPLKILINTSTPFVGIKKPLACTSVFVQVSYQESLSHLSLQDYDCIFLCDSASRAFDAEFCPKMAEYVKNGGGLLLAFSSFNYEHLGNDLPQKDLKICNKILQPMGMKFNNQASVCFQTVIVTEKEPIQISLARPYKKQQNPPFLYKKQDNGLLEIKKKLLQGVGVWNWGGEGLTVSSFDFSEQSYMSLLKQNDQSFGVFGNYGKGKVFAFGHTQLFDTKMSQKQTSRNFLKNLINWMTGSKSENISIGLLYQSGDNWPEYGWETGLDMNISSKFIENADDVKNQDIICVVYYSHYPEGLTPQFLQKLNLYVENGGNLVFASHGWVWEPYGEYQQNKSLVFEKDFASYLILESFGILLNKDWLGLPSLYDPNESNLMSKDQETIMFLKKDLMDVLKSKEKKNFNAKEQQVEEIISKINAVDQSLFELVCPIELYHELVENFIESEFNVEKNTDLWLSPYNNQSQFDCQVFRLMNALSYAVPPHICRALPPSLNKYPGYAINRLQEKKVKVFRNRNRIVFTGLYLNPGEVVKVKHENQLHDLRGVQLKLNFNLDIRRTDSGRLERFTDLTKTFKLKSKQFLIASPHGGILYFEVDEGSNQEKPLLFTFEGAYQGVYWNENIHTYEDFKKIKKIDAPMFIIETKRMNLIGQTKGVFSDLNIPIERLCGYWNKVVTLCKQYRGIDEQPFHKDAIFSDSNKALGYYTHSGNPIMMHDDIALEMIGMGGKLFTNPKQDFYHYLGHNHQDPKWTVEQTQEVTCYIYFLYLNYKMHGKTIQEFMWKEQQLERNIIQNLTQTSYYTSMPEDPERRQMFNYSVQHPYVRLAFFAILMEEFGYQLFSEVHKAYDKIVLPDNSYATKFDTLMGQVSIAAKHNVWQYFKGWRMPVTKASLEKVKHFEKYECKRFPFITQE